MKKTYVEIGSRAIAPFSDQIEPIECEDFESVKIIGVDYPDRLGTSLGATLYYAIVETTLDS